MEIMIECQQSNHVILGECVSGGCRSVPMPPGRRVRFFFSVHLHELLTKQLDFTYYMAEIPPFEAISYPYDGTRAACGDNK